MKKILMLVMLVIMALFTAGCFDFDDDIASNVYAQEYKHVTYTNMTDRVLLIDFDGEDEQDIGPEDSLVRSYSKISFGLNQQYIQNYTLNSAYFDNVTKLLIIDIGISIDEEIYAETKVIFTNRTNQ